MKRTRSTASGAARRADHATIAAGAALVSVNLCVFGPFEIISSNPGEFTTGFLDVLPFLLAAAVVVGGTIFAAGWWLPRRPRRGYAAFVAAIGILLWIQGSFLRWGYGVFDGTGIDWDAFVWQGWVDLALWIAVLVAASRFRDAVVRHAAFVCVGLIAVQSALAFTHALVRSDSEGGGTAAESGSVVPAEMCRLSATRNVFHFIMDSFQTDVFLELVREEGWAQAFDGFVVYQENASAGARTVLSVPSCFSTNVYDGAETEAEYFHRASGGSFVYLLFDRGYVVNLMPHVTMESVPHTNYFVRSATYAESRRSQQARTATYLLDVSMFRQFPHFGKRLVYNDQNWRLSAIIGDPPGHLSFHQKAFFHDYTNRLEIGGEKPAYHFIHLMPPHPPFVTNPDGSYAGHVLPYTRENYKTEAKFILRLFVDFLERLKSFGLYDSATILLHGDHGVGMKPRVSGMTTSERMGKVAALLLLKTEDAHGPLRVTTAQTSLTDIPATLMDLLGIEHPYPGDSIVELDPDEVRPRRAVFVTDRAAASPTIHRWLIRGSIYDEASWHELAPRKLEKGVRQYEWGTKLTFGIAGNGDSYLTRGWSTTSPTLHWNDGDSAEMTLAVIPTDARVIFEMVFFPYLFPGKVDRQRIHVEVNGHTFPVIDCVTRAPRTIRAEVPRDAIAGGLLKFRFSFPDAVSPRSIGEGRDSRSLAIGLYRFETFLDE